MACREILVDVRSWSPIQRLCAHIHFDLFLNLAIDALKRRQNFFMAARRAIWRACCFASCLASASCFCCISFIYAWYAAMPCMLRINPACIMIHLQHIDGWRRNKFGLPCRIHGKSDLNLSFAPLQTCVQSSQQPIRRIQGLNALGTWQTCTPW